MRKLAIYSLAIGMLAGISTAQANNLEYMINPTDDAHKVPVEVSEVGTDENGQKEFAVKYEDSGLGEIAPAAGDNAEGTAYDHFLGH